MPRKLDQNEIRQKFIEAGFIPDNSFNYRNNKQKHKMFDILNNKWTFISLQTLNYNIKKGHRPLWQQPQPMHDMDDEVQDNSPLTRFKNKHQLPSELPVDEIFNQYQQLCSKIGKKQNFSWNFQPDPSSQTTTMQAIILALNDITPKLISRNSGLKLMLKVITRKGFERYFQVNPTTLADLWAIFGAGLTPDFSVEDSSGNFALDTLDIAQIDFMFSKSKSKNANSLVSAGFFPFINTQSSIDLSRYGIYSATNIAAC